MAATAPAPPINGSPDKQRKPILIAGAGLASLLLAQRLLQADIPFLVYEREASISVRSQGYRLRLSAEGLDAIEASLGPVKFQHFWERCGQTGGGGLGEVDAITGEEVLHKVRPVASVNGGEKKDESNGVVNGNGNVNGSVNGNADEDAKKKEEDDDEALRAIIKRARETLTSRGGKVVGIGRGDMRLTFMEGCEPYMRWAHQVTGYEVTDSGVRLIFADGTRSVEGELLVGGEGFSSKVARQLSGGKIKVFDLGARGIHGQALTPAFKGLGEGVWRIVDDTKPNGRVSVITNVRSRDMEDPNIEFGWTMVASPGVIVPPNDNYAIIGKPAADIAKALTANWHPRVKSLFTEMNVENAAFWKLSCSTPEGVPEWKNEARVTLIGDAAHAMTPAGGNGANTACRDSELLGRLLAESGGHADGVTAAYEKIMREYASEAVRASYRGSSLMYQVEINEKSKVL